jgi:hypothetical protein
VWDAVDFISKLVQAAIMAAMMMLIPWMLLKIAEKPLSKEQAITFYVVLVLICLQIVGAGFSF